MTLVVGAKYPCGPLRGINLPQAVVLVTDTRWTKYYPQSNNPVYEDVATKLFTFPDINAIIAYAGDVQSGEHCINSFEISLPIKKRKNIAISLYILQRTFQRTYAYHKKTRQNKVFALHILLGVCDNIGTCRLIYFSSPKFKPFFIEGIKGIGIREACKAVEDEINQKINALNNVKLQEDAEHFGMFLAGTMNDLVVRSGEYDGIGGLIHLAILNKNEIILPSLHYTKDPTGKTDTWHRATVRPSEITTYQEKYKLGPDFINPRSFKLHPISD